jgi:hypothetical protein
LPPGAVLTIDDSDDTSKSAVVEITESNRKATTARGRRPADGEPPSTPDAKRRAPRTSTVGTDAFVTPISKKLKTGRGFTAAAAAAAVTPEEAFTTNAAAENEALSNYVPKYIHKNLDYKREGEKDLPKVSLDVYRLVCEHYEIPASFEQRRAFGPLSGVSYEERIIREYSIGNLSPKEGEAVSICTSCASLGHKREDCPNLI